MSAPLSFSIARTRPGVHVISKPGHIGLSTARCTQRPLTHSQAARASSVTSTAADETAVVELNRRNLLSGLLCSAAAAVLLPETAHAKPALLDVPSCRGLQPGGRLQYCDTRVGTGPSPELEDVVVVDYTARAVSTGVVFDGSRNFKFMLGQGMVMPGWELALLGDGSMPPIKEGGARTVVLPPELAYGIKGDGCLFGRPESCRIPPGSPVEITFVYRGTTY